MPESETLNNMNPWLLLKYHVHPSQLTMDPDDILPLRQVNLTVAPNQNKSCFKSMAGPPGWIEGLGLCCIISNASDRYLVLSSILLEFSFFAGWFAYTDPENKMKFRLHTFSSIVDAACTRLKQQAALLHDTGLLEKVHSIVRASLHCMHRYGMLQKKRLVDLLPCVEPYDMTHGYTLDLSKYKPMYIEAPSADLIWGKENRNKKDGNLHRRL